MKKKPSSKKILKLSDAEFDRKFDAGEDISEYLDFAKARRPGISQKRVNVDFPMWVVQSLDHEARRLGVTRQSIIKMWVADRIQQNK
ncbi:MAG: CopG family transcriptional regulator [Alphaproteobacteria bacterium]|nr:CopG family transcriptional regulator [Alphaproteobacteria bacterium]